MNNEGGLLLKKELFCFDTSPVEDVDGDVREEDGDVW